MTVKTGPSPAHPSKEIEPRLEAAGFTFGGSRGRGTCAVCGKAPSRMTHDKRGKGAGSLYITCDQIKVSGKTSFWPLCWLIQPSGFDERQGNPFYSGDQMGLFLAYLENWRAHRPGTRLSESVEADFELFWLELEEGDPPALQSLNLRDSPPKLREALTEFWEKVRTKLSRQLELAPDPDSLPEPAAPAEVASAETDSIPDDVHDVPDVIASDAPDLSAVRERAKARTVDQKRNSASTTRKPRSKSETDRRSDGLAGWVSIGMGLITFVAAVSTTSDPSVDRSIVIALYLIAFAALGVGLEWTGLLRRGK